jgi:hypothetical protein
MGNEPLHKRAHFRRIREVFIELAKYEQFNPRDYNMYKVRAYETVGENMKGKNVSYNVKDGSSFWVLDNRYDVFEVPHINNKEGWPYGEFLFLAYNRSFQYYVFGYMKIDLDRSTTSRNRYVTESVYYRNHGKYTIVFESHDNNIVKIQYGRDFDPGVPSSDHTFDFDKFNNRKRAYGYDSYKIIGAVDPSFRGTSDPNKIANARGKVPVYKKNGASKPAAKKISGSKETSELSGQKKKNYSKRYH